MATMDYGRVHQLRRLRAGVPRRIQRHFAGRNHFVIDPLLCTECVGFHDYEAAPPSVRWTAALQTLTNIESEEALIARARVVHPKSSSTTIMSRVSARGKEKAASRQWQKRLQVRLPLGVRWQASLLR